MRYSNNFYLLPLLYFYLFFGSGGRSGNNDYDYNNLLQQMLARSITRSIYWVSSIRQSLKLLDIATPTNKAYIKKQYLSLAKKYHPDSIPSPKQQATTIQKQSHQKLKKQLQQKFVQINKAYQYLNDLTQQQINSNKDKEQFTSSSSSSSASSQQPFTRRRTVEEEMRQQTYQYFNKRYQQQYMNMGARASQANFKNNQSYHQYLEQDYAERKKNPLPLYKVVPQFFVGLGLLAVVLIQWGYRVHKKKKMKERGEFRELGEGQFPESTPSRLDVYRGLNHRAMFDRKRYQEQQL